MVFPWLCSTPQGKYEGAEPLYHRALDLGGDHRQGPSRILRELGPSGWAAHNAGESHRVPLYSQGVPYRDMCASIVL